MEGIQNMKSRLTTLQVILNKMVPGAPPGGSKIIRLGPSPTTLKNLPCSSLHQVSPWRVCVSVHTHTLKLLLSPIFDSHLFPGFFNGLFIPVFKNDLFMCACVYAHACACAQEGQRGRWIPGPLQEQQALLITEKSPQPPCFLFILCSSS